MRQPGDGMRFTPAPLRPVPAQHAPRLRASVTRPTRKQKPWRNILNARACPLSISMKMENINKELRVYIYRYKNIFIFIFIYIYIYEEIVGGGHKFEWRVLGRHNGTEHCRFKAHKNRLKSKTAQPRPFWHLTNATMDWGKSRQKVCWNCFCCSHPFLSSSAVLLLLLLLVLQSQRLSVCAIQVINHFGAVDTTISDNIFHSQLFANPPLL